MKDGLYATHGVLHASAVRYRADMRGKRRLQDIESDDIEPQVRQRAEQGLAKMAGASRNQDLHDFVTSLAMLGSHER
jgi:hypothetical protein